MRVMVLGKAAEGGVEGAAPTKEAFAAMDAFIEELVKAGVLVAGGGLKPARKRSASPSMAIAARSSTGR